MSTTYPSKPTIAISANLHPIESGSFIGRGRFTLNQDYVDAIQAVGGIPFILPFVKDEEMIERQLEKVDGIILSGGYDINPLYYGEEPIRGICNLCPERDHYEMQLAKIAYRMKKPILGICRGLQILNVALGGTLYQDIKKDEPESFEHGVKANPEEAVHSVNVMPDTFLYKIVMQETLQVNSFHHQAIKDLAPGLTVNAKAKDGVIEGIEGTGEQFILGLQWHPETMLKIYPFNTKIFQALIEAAKK